MKQLVWRIGQWSSFNGHEKRTLWRDASGKILAFTTEQKARAYKNAITQGYLNLSTGVKRESVSLGTRHVLDPEPPGSMTQ